MIDAALLVEHLATPLVVLDAHGIVRAANPAFLGWIGLSARRLLEQPVTVLGEDAALGTLFERARTAGEVVRMRRVRVAPTPEHERFADASATPVFEQDVVIGV